jgi:hypothetical protein
MNEWLMIAAMATGGICFSIGGTGFRWVRFAIMPVLLGLICWKAGIAWQRDLGFVIPAAIDLTLGYGEKVPYWRKCLVFAGYGLSVLILGFTWWVFLVGPLCLLLFFLSNWKPTSSTFVWKICEFLFGTYLGCAVASVISHLK